MSRVATTLAGILAVPAVIGTSVSAEPACPRVDGRATEVLVCRGALSMGSHGTRLTADDDLTLRVRASPVAAGDDGVSLSPGACAWVDRPAGSGASRLDPHHVRGNELATSHAAGASTRAGPRPFRTSASGCTDTEVTGRRPR